MTPEVIASDVYKNTDVLHSQSQVENSQKIFTTTSRNSTSGVGTTNNFCSNVDKTGYTLQPNVSTFKKFDGNFLASTFLNHRQLTQTLVVDFFRKIHNLLRL